MRLLSVLLTCQMLLWGSASVHAESYLIKDANVFTGDDSPAVRQDILIVDGRIESLGTDLAGSEAQTVIDAAGRPVTPAFFAGITAAFVSSMRVAEHLTAVAMTARPNWPDQQVLAHTNLT